MVVGVGTLGVGAPVGVGGVGATYPGLFEAGLIFAGSLDVVAFAAFFATLNIFLSALVVAF